MLSRASLGQYRGLWLALGIGLIALVALTVAVGARPTALEIAAANAAPTNGIVAAGSWLVSGVGDVAVWWAIVLLVATSLAWTRPWAAVELLAVAGVAELASLALKGAVSRSRPAAASATDLIVGAGFPSGHVVRVAVVLGASLVLLPLARRHPRSSILCAVIAVAAMSVARVAAGDHYIADVLGGILLATVILAGWALLRIGVLSRQKIVIASLSLILAASVLAAAPPPSLAASPEPSRASGGDPRSSGQGPGFVGDAPMAIVITLAVGVGAAFSTYAYVRLTAKRRRDDIDASLRDT